MIIESRLDTDLYKYTMGQFVWKYYRGTQVRVRTKNRSNTNFVRAFGKDGESRIRKELAHVRNLELSTDELSYLASLGLFEEAYIDYLAHHKLPEVGVQYSQQVSIALETIGNWEDAIFWETYMLSILNELYTGDDVDYSLGRTRLSRKIAALQTHETPVKIIEFGTRRRASRAWQYEVTRTLQGFNLLTGTSNVALAKELKLPPIGTMAHELFMGVAALHSHTDVLLQASPMLVLDQWSRMYGQKLNVWLPDTFGSYSFFRDLDPIFTQKYCGGFRHDSGDPVAFAHKMLEWWDQQGITRQPTLVFSDGLKLPTILMLNYMFGEKADVMFGWGTDLTNDLGNPAPSIVAKLMSANSNPTIKFSDQPSKGTNLGAPIVERYKKVFEPERSASLWKDS